MATKALSPKYIEIASKTAKPTALFLLVHGLGDSSAGMRPLADYLKSQPELGHIKWVVPDAPARSITMNFGMAMPAWFDFGGPTEDEENMLKSMASFEQLITEQIESTGIEENRVVMGGFSQGGMMSLLNGLTTKRKLAGLVVMSGRLQLQSKFKSMASSHASSIPIFWGHGTDDPLVTYNHATTSIEFMKSELGITEASDADVSKGLTFKAYKGMEHSIDPEELGDVAKWLRKIIPEKA